MPKKEEIEQVLALSEEKKQMLRCIYHYYHKWQVFYTRQRQKYKITNQDLMEEGHFSSHTLKRLNDAIYSQDLQNRLRLSIIRILKYRDEEERTKHSKRDHVKSLVDEFNESYSKFDRKMTLCDNEQLIKALAIFSNEQKKGTLYRKAEILYQYEMITK